MNILNLLCTFITLILVFIHPLIHKYNLSSYYGLGSVLGIDTDICELCRGREHLSLISAASMPTGQINRLVGADNILSFPEPFVV